VAWAAAQAEFQRGAPGCGARAERQLSKYAAAAGGGAADNTALDVAFALCQWRGVGGGAALDAAAAASGGGAVGAAGAAATALAFEGHARRAAALAASCATRWAEGQQRGAAAAAHKRRRQSAGGGGGGATAALAWLAAAAEAAPATGAAELPPRRAVAELLLLEAVCREGAAAAPDDARAVLRWAGADAGAPSAVGELMVAALEARGGNRPAASSHARRAMLADAALLPSAFALGLLCFDSGELERAATHFAACSRSTHFELSAAGFGMLASTRARQGRVWHAVDSLRAIIEMHSAADPAAAETALLNVAIVYGRCGASHCAAHLRTVELLLQLAASRQPAAAPADDARSTRFVLGAPSSSAPSSERITSQRCTVLHMAARAALRDGQWASACAHFVKLSKVLAEAPSGADAGVDSLQLHKEHCYACLQESRHEAALQLADHALAHCPYDVELLMHKADALTCLCNWPDALAAVERCLTLLHWTRVCGDQRAFELVRVRSGAHLSGLCGLAESNREILLLRQGGNA